MKKIKKYFFLVILLKMTRNGNKIKQWFITLPTWTTIRDTTSDTCKSICEEFPKAIYSLACQEAHESENSYHYHLLLILRFPISKINFIKWIKDKFPADFQRVKIEPCKSVNDAIDYIRKESTVIYENGKKPERGCAKGIDFTCLSNAIIREFNIPNSIIQEASNLGITLAEFLLL